MASGKQIMVIAMDDSPHSMYALEWTLDHFYTPFGSLRPFHLVVVHARPVPISFLQLATTGGMVVGGGDIGCGRLTDGVNALGFEVNTLNVEVMEGDPRNVLCEAVDKHRASVLVIGSHGYGLVKRAVLGSVSDYCAHHAHCSVMIVKKPKT
ncbi:MJ0531-like protein [Hibiscus syriacus]|uniref:MJ0531-like protein n=1 Tax=Hibiscus syriacus TaxID=106335 RepID=A0A6A2Y933_HIBSY|nr:MJ0531-like protein [Hibiscus syriacus]